MNLKTSYLLSGVKSRLIPIIILAGILLSACKSERFTLPENTATIRFTNSTYTIDLNAPQALNVVLPLSLPLEEDATATVNIDSKSTALSSQYTIDPGIPADGLKLNLLKGATQTSFNVTSLGNFEGDVTLVLKITIATGGAMVSNTNASTTITIHGKPIVLPAIVSSVTMLDFSNVTTGTASTSKPFTVSGTKLTSNISIVAPTSFQVSLNNITFTSSVTVGFAAANAAPVNVYARFLPNTGTNQPLSGSINMSSGTVPTISITVTGSEVGNAASGVLVMKEDFNYGSAAGNMTTASGGAWSAYSAGGSLPVQYIATGLSFTGYAGSGIGGALVSQNNSKSAEDLTWSFPSLGSTSGAIYTSQLLNFASAPTTPDFFTSLGDGAAGATPVYYNRIYAKANGSQYVLGVDRNATAPIGYTTANYDYGTTYLVVTKYDFVSGVSSIYILSGAIPTVEPANPDATSSGGAADPAALTRVVIRQSTNTPLSVTYDGVRIATSWRQAVGL
jgi:hypothetical protein